MSSLSELVADVGRLVGLLVAALGGLGFLFWKALECYRNRVRVTVTEVSIEPHEEDEIEIHMVIENNGPRAVLIKRSATIRGVHLGVGSPSSWIRPAVKVDLQLIGDPRLDSITSQLTRWRIVDTQVADVAVKPEPVGTLYWLFWTRVTIRLSTVRRRAVVRSKSVGEPRIGLARYWVGYWLFKLFGHFLGLTRRRGNR